MSGESNVQEGQVVSVPETQGYVMNQTMLRIKDPQRSLEFYSSVLGMTLIKEFRFPEMEFSLYFMGYVTEDDEPIPDGAEARVYWILVDVSGDAPNTVASGYYDDTYVKTAEGWRFKTRTISADRAG